MKDKEIKTAEKRGMEMMYIPMGKLPKLALDFLRYRSARIGFCGEVCLTCYTVYAQCVEKLTCTDNLYKARKRDIKWFKEHQ